MARVSIHPRKLDRRFARMIAKFTFPAAENSAKVVTWAGDEKLLAAAVGCALAASLLTSRKSEAVSHVAENVVVTSALSHLIKLGVAQKRPDRSVKHRRRRGIPKSGNARDAFPSGHAMQVGGLAAALSRYCPGEKPAIWGIAAAVALTRAILLAHWVTDIGVGFGLGVVVEQLLWTLREDRADGS